MTLEQLTAAQISVMYVWDLVPVTREKYPDWVAVKGTDKEYGNTAEEAVLKLCEKLDIL